MSASVSRVCAAISENQQELLSVWNDTASEYPRNFCIHQLFESEAKRRPDAIAVRFGQQLLTYRQVNERANQLARRLIRLGVGPDVKVVTLVDRSVDLVIVLLGILKAGGAYVPLDASYPVERLAYMASDISPTVTIVQESVARRLADTSWTQGKTLRLEESLGNLEGENTTNVHSQATPETLAYVMYTSGSTGQPKGVMVPHRAVVRLVKNTNYVDLSEKEVFLQFSPISFDASTFEIWGPLLNGGCLAVMSPDKQSLADLGAAIRDFGVTTLWLTAGLFNVMVEQRVEDLRPLKQLLVGGDALSPSHIRSAMNAAPHCRIINGYGPTECTTFSCCHAISSHDTESSSIPIGKPIANTLVYIVNCQNQLVSPGEIGELWIGGDGLARGYLNQSDLTAAKFLPNPFSEEPGARIYKTGDLARHRPDGAIEFQGRVDNQVKINGYRIEPGEVEAILMKHVSVLSAAVIARQDAPGEKKLVAYVVASGSAISAADIRSYLEQRLPFYMLPAAIVFLDALPLTPNGKVDRAALPRPGDEGERRQGSSAQNEIETKIEAVWLRVLGIHCVKRDDNFFDVGGDSLQLLTVHAELQKTVDPGLIVTDMFEYPTIRMLGERVSGAPEQSRNLAGALDRVCRQKMAWASQTQSRRNNHE